MRYNPIFLALLLCFSTSTFSNTNEISKNKNQTTVKQIKGKQTAALNTTKNKKDSIESKVASSKDNAPKSKLSLKKSPKETDDTQKKETREKENKINTPKTKESLASNGKNKKAKEDDNTDKKISVQSDKKRAINEKNNLADTPSSKIKNKQTINKKQIVSSTEDKEDTKKERKIKTTENSKDNKADKKTDNKNNIIKSNKKTEEKAEIKPDSETLRDAVSAATNDLEEKKALKNRADGMLIRVSNTLAQTRGSLALINKQQRDAWDKFEKLNTDLNRLKAEVGNTRAQISRFVTGNYKNSQPTAVALFLQKAEPGQKTRFLRYTRYINSANEQVVRDLSKQQKELSAQENRLNAELARLKRLQASTQTSLKKQGVNNSAEQLESRRQNALMAKEAGKVVNQKDNEQRLNNLLSDIDKRKAEQRKKEALEKKKAAEARLAAAEKARQTQKIEEERAALSNLTAEDLKLQAPLSIATNNPNSFSRMQGRLKKPVSAGMLSGLFGHERSDGQVWKGVFYNTIPSPVSSIATGTVVYANELEGYGKVVVVDHGDKYVSVYSGLSEISVSDGYTVGAGHKLGTSGTLPTGEEGLYLEIRYDGQNMNPLSWIN